MPKIFSILLIGLSGYYLIKKRYRILNTVLRSRLLRKYLIKFAMNLPGLRNQMMSTVFSKPTS
ncbi:hypothetical protein [Niallia nealsonii]|uniref:Uncharacterized protein n=1 Tax=Niallia nealsonii TaxID=115979 RepID=A0A2N0Z893_9BACI|nr:hypothetical protein [Niallia nealsonii]PKG25729.1 hypothetical protein CWS01_00425 [Niallia nealsonii]